MMKYLMMGLTAVGLLAIANIEVKAQHLPPNCAPLMVHKTWVKANKMVPIWGGMSVDGTEVRVYQNRKGFWASVWFRPDNVVCMHDRGQHSTKVQNPNFNDVDDEL